MFMRRKRGTIAVLTALFIGLAAAANGAAVDIVNITNAREALQNAVDNAALAAVRDPANARERAEAIFDLSVGDEGSLFSSLVREHTTQGGQHVVQAEAVVRTLVLRAFGLSSVQVAVSATAEPAPHAEAAREVGVCLKLNANSGVSLSVQADAQLVAPDCVVMLNDTDPTRLDVAGDVDFAGFCFAKGVAPADMAAIGATLGAPYTPEICAAVQPVDQIDPATPACDHTDYRLEPGASSGTVLPLRPGVYCAPTHYCTSVQCQEMDAKRLIGSAHALDERYSMELAVHRYTELGGGTIQMALDITLEPGLYEIVDGDVWLPRQARVTGNGVTFVVSGADAEVHLHAPNRHAHMTPLSELKAPETGRYAGILLMQKPSAYGAPISLGHGLDMQGAIVAPKSAVRIQSDQEITASELQVDSLMIDRDALLILDPRRVETYPLHQGPVPARLVR